MKMQLKKHFQYDIPAKEEMDSKFLKQIFTEYIPSAESCLQWKNKEKGGILTTNTVHQIPMKKN